ncbi:MAG: polysaccharide deacetylase family protein [Candidatus Omnitrophica bacterium]|nr:polysaccharide deacetylase family protein [Candidatus Omnitrophota bacterium]
MSNCTVITYHYVRDVNKTNFPELKALAVKDFLTQLDWLEANYRILDSPSFHAALHGETKITKPSVLLTFDDGFKDHYETVFPILKKRGISAIFFVPTNCLIKPQMLNVHRIHFLLARIGAERLRDLIGSQIEQSAMLHPDKKYPTEFLYRWDQPPDAVAKQWLNYELPYDVADSILKDLFEVHLGNQNDFAEALYLSPAMIEEMADGGMAFGGHTWNHRVLSRLTVDEQKREIGEAPDLIRSLTGQHEISFCYPYGLRGTYTNETIRSLKAAGYSSAFTVAAGSVSFDGVNHYELPREDARDIQTRMNSEHLKSRS